MKLKEKILDLYILFSVTALLLSSNWGIDALHDGATYPSAVAISQDKKIFAQIQNQYGMVQPIIEGSIMKLFGNQLIIQRLIGTTIILLIALCIYTYLSPIIGKFKSKLVSIFYLAIYPSWNTFSTNSWPENRSTWPNNYGIFLQLLFIILVSRKNNKFTDQKFFLSGIVLAISAFTRIQFLVSSIFIIFIIISCFRKKAKLILYGYFIGIMACIAFLLINNSITYFVEQIIYALFYQGANSVSIINPFLVTKNLLALLGFIGILLFINYLPLSTVSKISLNVLFIIICSYVIYPNSESKKGKIYSFLELGTGDLVLWPVPVIIIITTALIIYYWTTLIIKKTSIKISLNFEEKILTFVCLTSWFQMHNMSSDYLYMIFPLYILTFTVFLKKIKIHHPDNSILTIISEKSINPLITSLIVTSIINYSVASSKMIYSFENPQYNLMKTNNLQNKIFLDRVYDSVKDMKKRDLLSIDCPYALFSVNEFGYRASSRYPWNLIPDKMLEDKLSIEKKLTPEYLLVCPQQTSPELRFANPSEEYRVRDSFIDANGGEFIVYSRFVR